VTAGGPTVALRVPAHPVALALLRTAGVPVAAPSANRSGLLSPTRGEHVLLGLDGRIDVLLDAGPTTGGVESTVLDLSSHPPRLLRPGLVSAAEIEAIVGLIDRPPDLLATLDSLPSLHPECSRVIMPRGRRWNAWRTGAGACKNCSTPDSESAG
jgi:L-threonylcarbamoyladenylate synthase